MNDRLVAALIEARRLNNQTVRKTNEVAAWHQEVDAILADLGDPTPRERYDDPARAEHRRFVSSLFR